MPRSNADSSSSSSEEEEEEEDDDDDDDDAPTFTYDLGLSGRNNKSGADADPKAALRAKLGLGAAPPSRASGGGAVLAASGATGASRDAFPWSDDALRSSAAPGPRDESPSSVLERRQATASTTPPSSERLPAAAAATREAEKDGRTGPAAASAKDEAGRPGGWAQFVDESSGVPYWFNEASGESSWAQPEAATA
jgi:hypothetical protein